MERRSFIKVLSSGLFAMGLNLFSPPIKTVNAVDTSISKTVIPGEWFIQVSGSTKIKDVMNIARNYQICNKNQIGFPGIIVRNNDTWGFLGISDVLNLLFKGKVSLELPISSIAYKMNVYSESDDLVQAKLIASKSETNVFGIIDSSGDLVGVKGCQWQYRAHNDEPSYIYHEIMCG